jgi:hypothetical protein
VLAGLSVNERDWAACRDGLWNTRARLERVMGLGRDGEIHAAEFLGGARIHRGLEPWQRVRAAQWIIEDLGELGLADFVICARRKQVDTDHLGECWRELCAKSAERATSGEHLLLVTDVTDGQQINQALHRLEPQVRGQIIDDPFHRDSRESVMLQAADLAAYLARQTINPNGLFRSGIANGLLRDFRELSGFTGEKREEPGRGPGS